MKCSRCKKEHNEPDKKTCKSCRLLMAQQRRERKLFHKDNQNLNKISNDSNSDIRKSLENLNKLSDDLESALSSVESLLNIETPLETIETFETPLETIETFETVETIFETNETEKPLDLDIFDVSEVSDVSDVSDVSSNISSSSVHYLDEFKVKTYIKPKLDIQFIHPYTMKLMGSRGSGKTTWLINYLNFIKGNEHFDRIIWFTTTEAQSLLNHLKIKVNFVYPDIIVIKKLYDKLREESLVEENRKKNLIIFDDCMQERAIRNNKTIQEFYTKGRHLYISIISLEQHLNYSSNVERGNTDYFLLFKFNDLAALNLYRKKFCSEYNEEHFLIILRHCWSHNKPLMLTFNNFKYKFRYNFNQSIEYCDSKIKVKKIIKEELPPKIEGPVIKKKKSKFKKFYKAIGFIGSILI